MTMDHERLTLVRDTDRERYIAALLAPADRRADLMALFAFDAEMTRIPQAVSQPLLGEIRLQWWRDVLAPLLTDAGRAAPLPARTGHPLADDLLALARRRALPGGLLHGLIDARSAELSDQPLSDEGQLSVYLSKSEGAVFALAARILAPGRPVEAGMALPDGVCESAGRAVGWVKLAQAVLAGRSNADLLVPISLWPMRDRSGTQAEGVRARGAHRLLDLARLECDRLRPTVAGLPRPLRPALLPLALVPRYVTHLRRAAVGGHLPPRAINPLLRLWTLWRASRAAQLIV